MDESIDPQSHAVSLMYVVGRVNQGIRREMSARLATWNLSVAEYTTLTVLAARPGLSNAQLARRALVTPQSMIELLSKLEARALVTRAIDPAHNRILRAELTDHGHKVIGLARPVIAEIQEQMLAGVPIEDRQAALRVMVSAMEWLSA
jgi:DNA-binding MarR family transcriptional regulator